jgi:hypothetical protein
MAWVVSEESVHYTRGQLSIEQRWMTLIWSWTTQGRCRHSALHLRHINNSKLDLSTLYNIHTNKSTHIRACNISLQLDEYIWTYLVLIILKLTITWVLWGEPFVCWLYWLRPVKGETDILLLEKLRQSIWGAAHLRTVTTRSVWCSCCNPFVTIVVTLCGEDTAVERGGGL